MDNTEWIVNMRNLIAYLESISMNYPSMAIVKLVPLVPLMAQVAETHIYNWRLSKICFSK